MSNKKKQRTFIPVKTGSGYFGADLQEASQLSEDVEELFKDIITAEDITIPSPSSAGLPTDYVELEYVEFLKRETKDKIKQKLQAQASEIERLKAQLKEQEQ